VKGINSSRLENARATLNATPRYIQENILSDYNYRFYKVGVNLTMKMNLMFLNLRNNTLSPTKNLEYKVENKEGEIYEGVQASDVNSLQNGSFNVPDLANEKYLGQQKLIQDIQTEIKDFVSKEKGIRYCRVKANKSETQLMSSYQLCLIYSDNSQLLPVLSESRTPASETLENSEISKAKKKLFKFYQMSEEDVQKYGEYGVSQKSAVTPKE
jgi:hypothetical protein